MIAVRDLEKTYRVQKRAPGLGAALKALVSREYTSVRAVDGVSFSIEAGERVGFLGPNGAGKTTTLKILSGLLHPSAGEVRVDGHEPRRREEGFLGKITLVLGQKQQLMWDLPPADTFELNRAIYGVDRATFDKRIAGLVDLLEIGEQVKRPTRSLSLGERMKCELAASLVHGPKLLFLDEPTIGLDVNMQGTLRDFIRRYNEDNGATLILTSHNMADVASLCPRVMLIDAGKLVFDGRLEELVRKTKPEKRITLRLESKVAAADLEALGTVVSHEDARAVIKVPPADVSPVVAKALASLPVSDLEVADPPLEEIMADVFGKKT